MSETKKRKGDPEREDSPTTKKQKSQNEKSITGLKNDLLNVYCKLDKHELYEMALLIGVTDVSKSMTMTKLWLGVRARIKSMGDAHVDLLEFTTKFVESKIASSLEKDEKKTHTRIRRQTKLHWECLKNEETRLRLKKVTKFILAQQTAAAAAATENKQHQIIRIYQWMPRSVNTTHFARTPFEQTSSSSSSTSSLPDGQSEVILSPLCVTRVHWDKAQFLSGKYQSIRYCKSIPSFNTNQFCVLVPAELECSVEKGPYMLAMSSSNDEDYFTLVTQDDNTLKYASKYFLVREPINPSNRISLKELCYQCTLPGEVHRSLPHMLPELRAICVQYL